MLIHGRTYAKLKKKNTCAKRKPYYKEGRKQEKYDMHGGTDEGELVWERTGGIFTSRLAVRVGFNRRTNGKLGKNTFGGPRIVRRCFAEVCAVCSPL